MKLMRRILVACTAVTALLLLAACGGTSTSAAAAAAAPAKNEILWDKYGVPHVYGTSAAAVFYGYGYAQAQSHADEILRLYGESRGRGAEYWGAKYEDTAVWLLKNDVPARSKALVRRAGAGVQGQPRRLRQGHERLRRRASRGHRPRGAGRAAGHRRRRRGPRPPPDELRLRRVAQPRRRGRRADRPAGPGRRTATSARTAPTPGRCRARRPPAARRCCCRTRTCRGTSTTSPTTRRT